MRPPPPAFGLSGFESASHWRSRQITCSLLGPIGAVSLSLSVSAAADATSAVAADADGDADALAPASAARIACSQWAPASDDLVSVSPAGEQVIVAVAVGVGGLACKCDEAADGAGEARRPRRARSCTSADGEGARSDSESARGRKAVGVLGAEGCMPSSSNTFVGAAHTLAVIASGPALASGSLGTCAGRMRIVNQEQRESGESRF